MKDQVATALQPLREIASLKPFTDDFSRRSEEIYHSIARRAFEIFESSGRVSGRNHEDWLKAEAELLHPVHLDIAESDGAVTVRVTARGQLSVTSVRGPPLEIPQAAQMAYPGPDRP